ncbi:MAG: ATP synthase F0 subunit C [Oscillospiraceae bacterium]|nr:ATP synthase F0 subunit C [Oscillospiraceae bacterium]
MNYIGIALSLLSCVVAAIAMGFAVGKAMDAIARQPESAGKINSTLLLGLALIESTAIYGFVIALILIFVGPASGG